MSTAKKTPARPTPKTKSAAQAPAQPAEKTAATRSSVQADQTAAFLREVDEAMRIERWQNLWAKGKLPLFAGVAVLIAGTAAWQGWQSWQAYTDRSTATRWAELAALPTEAEVQTALPAFVAESAYGYKALGVMAQAAAAKSPAEKITIYRALQNDAAQPEWLRAFGHLNAALVMLGTDPEAARAELALLAKTEIGTMPLPTAPLALELLALEAMQRNDKTAALGYTQKLLQLPEQGGILTPTLRERALERLGALGA